MRDLGYSIQRSASRGGSRVFRSYGYAIAQQPDTGKPPDAFVIQSRGTTSFAYTRSRQTISTPVLPGQIAPQPWWRIYTRGVGRAQLYAATYASGTGANRATFNEIDDDDEVAAESVLLGVLGSSVPALGSDGPALLYAEVVAYGLQANYVRAEILSVTPGYTLTFYSDTSFTLTAPQLTGVCEITYQWYIDGVLQAGTGTVTVDFPAFVALTAADDVDLLAATAESSQAQLNVVLALTDATDTMSALASSPVQVRSVYLVLGDDQDTTSGAALVSLRAASAAMLAVDQADTLVSIVQQDAERGAALDVTDQADTLLSLAYWLEPVNASLSALDSDNDIATAAMNTAPGAREKVTLKSAIVNQITLTSHIDLE